MNGLSWLLYLSGVVSSIGSFFMFVTVVSFFIFVAMGVAFLACRSMADEDYRKKDDQEKLKNAAVVYRRFSFSAFGFFLLFGLIGNMMPDRRTIIMIASSEMGEKLMKSDKVQAIVDPSLDLLKSYMEKEMLSVQKEIKKLKNADDK